MKSFTFAQDLKLTGLFGNFSRSGVSQIGVIIYKPICGLQAKADYEESLEAEQSVFPFVPDAGGIDFGSQFIAFETFDEDEDVVEEVTVDDDIPFERVTSNPTITNVGEVAEEEESSNVVPIIVAVVVVVLLILICIVCFKLSKRKRMVVEDADK